DQLVAPDVDAYAPFTCALQRKADEPERMPHCPDAAMLLRDVAENAGDDVRHCCHCVIVAHRVVQPVEHRAHQYAAMIRASEPSPFSLSQRVSRPIAPISPGCNLPSG